MFGAPKHILTDQGANFVSELVQNFETLFRIRHIKTSTYHLQSNGSLERSHSTLKDLIRTCMEDNKIELDNRLKIVSMAYNTIKYEGIGHSSFQLTFGREPNIPSMLNTTLSIDYSDHIQRWKNRHEKCLNKAIKRISLQKEKYKKQQDA